MPDIAAIFKQAIVHHGDSITANEGGTEQVTNVNLLDVGNHSYLPIGFAPWAQTLSGHRLKELANTG